MSWSRRSGQALSCFRAYEHHAEGHQIKPSQPQIGDEHVGLLLLAGALFVFA
jgi:hypothetical protein